MYQHLLRWGDEIVTGLRTDGCTLKGVDIRLVGKSACCVEPDSTVSLRTI